ncbi:hypothetical protein DFQ27_007626 [Actinomortierella ambigua]|uniref:Peroxin/Ferlin domain-containing protein n=1 Tax=Actinomortierella ambigua TaxID=1343610 RepID=A0A9P6PVW6_9FUNG|nr:hypothetical protein DFQ26_009548 [Actinomortierella ambigua]KAG0253175.1 hypothetical protein DFQ27_007626 [Actinomortierella ambigua]
MNPEHSATTKPPTFPVVAQRPRAAIALAELDKAPAAKSPQNVDPSKSSATNTTSPNRTHNSDGGSNKEDEDSSEDGQGSSGNLLALAAEKRAIDIAEDKLLPPPTPKQVVLDKVQDQETFAKVQEESEAALQQKMRVLPKLNTLKKTFTIKNPDPAPSAAMSTVTSDSYFPSAAGSSQLPSPTNTSRPSTPGPSEGGKGGFLDSIGDRMRTLDKGTFRKRTTRRKNKKDMADPATRLIQFNEPKLVDSTTTPGDSRFFHCKDDPEPEGDFAYDFLYQHQRGAFLLGTPIFSAKSLLPVDPHEWTDAKFRSCGLDISNYELPDPSWEWVHRSWLVDMTGDVDEDGWEYAMTFHGSPWHGSHEIFRSFSRRRRWLRLRKKKGITRGRPGQPPPREYNEEITPVVWTKADLSGNYLDSPSPFPPINYELPLETESPIGTSRANYTGLLKIGLPAKALRVDLYKILKKGHSDRQKLAHLAEYVVRYPGDFEDIENRLDAYLSLLDYESSRREMLVLLATYGRKEMVLKAIKKLEFYSDQKMLAKQVDSKATAKA